MPIPIVGENLRKAREDAGMSQAELAKRVGTSASQIGKYERALQDMTLTRVWELEKALNLQHGELLRGISRSKKDENFDRFAKKIYQAFKEYEENDQ
jgi:transcriptional regulator with XRE-family HTH domain